MGYVSLLGESFAREKERRRRPGALLAVGYLEHIGDHVGADIARETMLRHTLRWLDGSGLADGWSA